MYWLDVGVVMGPGGRTDSFYVGGQVMECAIGGCGNRPTVLGAAAAGQQLLAPSLAVDATHVYWSAGPNVVSCTIGGCACGPTILSSGLGATGLTVTSQRVYWTVEEADRVESCPLGGCEGAPATFTSSGGAPYGITHDDSHVYWVGYNDTVWDCPLGGCGDAGAASLVSAPMTAESTAVAVDANNLYWTSTSPIGTGAVWQCAKNDCQTTMMTLAAHRNNPAGMAIDATDVYWVEAGSVFKCAIGGCAGNPTPVAFAVPPAIAVDATHLYVVQSGPSAADGGQDPLDEYVVALPK